MQLGGGEGVGVGSEGIHYYCAFDVFQKVVFFFCLALHTEEVSLQTSVMV